jgi:hypothetical protein
MKMSFKEIEKIKSIMTNYREIHDELSSYEKELDRMSENESEKNENRIIHLGNKIKSCIKSLNIQRTDEKSMYVELEKKYGPGQIDVKTFEYKR